MIKVIIFDLDDTLYPEREYVRSGFRAVAAYLARKSHWSWQDIYKAIDKSFLAHGRGKTFDYALSELGLTDFKVSDLVKVYRGHSPSINLPAIIKTTLANLRKNFKLCLLTNGYPEVQKIKISRLKLEKYFDKIFYAQEKGLNFRKPHPKFFLKILREYNVKPQEALMIGDELEADIAGAARLGINTFFIRKLQEIANVQSIVKKYEKN